MSVGPPEHSQDYLERETCSHAKDPLHSLHLSCCLGDDEWGGAGNGENDEDEPTSDARATRAKEPTHNREVLVHQCMRFSGKLSTSAT